MRSTEMARNSLITLAPAVVFLGAGASAPLGKPTMSGFMPMLTRRLRLDFIDVDGVSELLSHVGHDLEELLEQLASMVDMPYVKAFIMESSNGPSVGPLPPLPPDIDPYGSMSANGPRLVRSIASRLRAAVHKAVIQQYGSVDKEQALALYGPFFDLLFTHFGEPSTLPGAAWPGLRSALLPVFTTNYDPAIEAFCEGGFARYALNDGFRYLEAERREGWTREHFDSPSRHHGKRNLALFKLHGSADWIMIGSRIRRAEPRYVTDGEEHWSNCLVYPAKKKVSLEDPYFTCYDYFLHCLEQTKVCVTIGYSFRDYDALTRVKSAMLNNERLILIVIAPDATEVVHRLGFSPERAKAIDLPFGRGGAGQHYLTALRNCLESVAPTGPSVVPASQ
jgi:hypothetical protein